MLLRGIFSSNEDMAPPCHEKWDGIHCFYPISISLVPKCSEMNYATFELVISWIPRMSFYTLYCPTPITLVSYSAHLIIYILYIALDFLGMSLKYDLRFVLITLSPVTTITWTWNGYYLSNSEVYLRSFLRSRYQVLVDRLT